MKTITEIEKNISLLNGIKIKYSDLIKNSDRYFHGRIFKDSSFEISPCKLLNIFTEINVSEDDFYSYYYIPTKKPDNYKTYYKYDNCMIPKEVLIFIGSLNGITSDYVCPIFPPYIDGKIADEILSRIMA